MGSEPTEITNDGTKVWRNDMGQFHRDDGPAVIYTNGTQYWYINGNLHREDGPAEIYPNGTQHWHINGKHHREDGPAVICPDGRQKWFINGHDITNKIHQWAKDRDIDLDTLSELDKMIIKLEWGNYGK